MKIRIYTILLCVVLLSGSVVSAQGPNKVSFSATEFFDPFGILGVPVGTYLPSDATVACPGHVPTGNPTQPCPVGSRTHLRNYKWMSRAVSSTPGISDGWMTIIANANFDAEFTGPQWGTFSLVYDSGGELAGTWQSLRVRTGGQWEHSLHASGKISGGTFDGANATISEQIVSFTPIPFAYIGTVEGRLVIPGSK